MRQLDGLPAAPRYVIPAACHSGDGMRVTIVERFCEGKFRDERNEDAIFEGPHTLAVVDGSTAAGPIAGESGGRVAASVVCRVLEALPADASVNDFAAQATAELAALGARHGVPAPFAAVAVLSLARREIWRIGDCPFAIDGVWSIADHFPHERAYFAFRRMMMRGYRDLGRHGEGAPALARVTADWLAMTRQWLNAEDHPIAFGALGGRLPPSRFVEVYPVPAGARTVTIASDGAIVSPRGQVGPVGVADMLAQIADLRVRDPQCLELFDYWRGFLDGAAYLDDTTLLTVAIEE
jgi:hypothetical protein